MRKRETRREGGRRGRKGMREREERERRESAGSAFPPQYCRSPWAPLGAPGAPYGSSPLAPPTWLSPQSSPSPVGVGGEGGSVPCRLEFPRQPPLCRVRAHRSPGAGVGRGRLPWPGHSPGVQSVLARALRVPEAHPKPSARRPPEPCEQGWESPQRLREPSAVRAGVQRRGDEGGGGAGKGGHLPFI